MAETDTTPKHGKRMSCYCPTCTDTEDPNIATLREALSGALNERPRSDAALLWRDKVAAALAALASTLAERDRRIAAAGAHIQSLLGLLEAAERPALREAQVRVLDKALADLTECDDAGLSLTEAMGALVALRARLDSGDDQETITAADRSAPEADTPADGAAAVRFRGAAQLSDETTAPAPGELALDGPLTLTVSVPQRDGCKGCGGPATITLAVGVNTYSFHEGFRCLPDCNYEEPDIEF